MHASSAAEMAPPPSPSIIVLEKTPDEIVVKFKWRRDAVMPAAGWSIDVPGVASPAVLVGAYESDDPDYIVLLVRAA